MNPAILHLVGRVLLALIFIIAGAGKLANPAGTAGYIASMGLPGFLVWPTIALELLGGIALAIGYQTKWVSWALAGFCIVAGAVFHNNFADQTQMVMFMKNLAIAGGLLILSVSPSNPMSLDARK